MAKFTVPEHVRADIEALNARIEPLEAARFNFLFGIGKVLGAEGNPKDWLLDLSNWEIDDSPSPDAVSEASPSDG